MVKLILYSLLTGRNAFVSTNGIVLMKAEMVLRGRKRGEKETGEGKKKRNQQTSIRLFEIKVLYC